MLMRSKYGWSCLAALAIFFSVFSVRGTNPAEIPSGFECSCHAPASITITGQSDGAVSFSWPAISGATGYRIWYVRSGDNYTSSYSNVTGTNTSYAGLPAGQYTFYVVTVCEGTTVSESIILEDLLIG